MTKEQCPLIEGVIYCQCGNPSSHYGTMGYRGAREVRESPPPEVRTSNEQLSRRWAVTLWRSLDRLYRAVKDCARIGFQESSPTTNAHHADIWNALNEAQKDAALKLDVFSRGLPDETPSAASNALAEMTTQRDHWLEIAREKDGEIERLRVGLERLVDERIACGSCVAIARATLAGSSSKATDVRALLQEGVTNMGAWEYDDLMNWRERAVIALGSSVETIAAPMPFGWARAFTSAAGPHEPPEHDWEAYVGDDPPTADAGWIPFYREAQIGLANAQEWHRLCQAIATILEVDSNGGRDEMGRVIADAIQRLRDRPAVEPSRELRQSGDDARPLRRPTVTELEQVLAPEKAMEPTEVTGCGNCVEAHHVLSAAGIADGDLAEKIDDLVAERDAALEALAGQSTCLEQACDWLNLHHQGPLSQTATELFNRWMSIAGNRARYERLTRLAAELKTTQACVHDLEAPNKTLRAVMGEAESSTPITRAIEELIAAQEKLVLGPIEDTFHCTWEVARRLAEYQRLMMHPACDSPGNGSNNAAPRTR